MLLLLREYYLSSKKALRSQDCSSQTAAEYFQLTKIIQLNFLVSN